jgi:hypothetical protein
MCHANDYAHLSPPPMVTVTMADLSPLTGTDTFEMTLEAADRSLRNMGPSITNIAEGTNARGEHVLTVDYASILLGSHIVIVTHDAAPNPVNELVAMLDRQAEGERRAEERAYKEGEVVGDFPELREAVAERGTLSPFTRNALASSLPAKATR